jgi:dsRNA-specific ribonuclease
MTTIFTVQTHFVYNKNKILKDLIVALLKFIIPEKDIQLYVTNDKMLIWKRAFTPEITNPSEMDSYEENEYIGDRILKVVFSKYLMERYPSYSSQYITNIDTLIMEKKHQAQLADALHLTEFVNMTDAVTVGIKGDLFESFFGALNEVSEKIEEEIGLIHCYNMICFIFNQNTIPEGIKEGDAKMNVEQTFIQLGLSPLQVNITKNGQQFIVKIMLKDEHLLFFINHGIIIKDYTLGESIGTSKNITIKNAYQQAKKTLAFYNINDDFVNKIKLEKQDEKKIDIKVKEKPTVNIKDLITPLLSKVIKTNQLNFYLSPKYMMIWDKLFDEDKDEKYRYYGEIILKGLIPKHLMNIYKGEYNKENYNNILSNMTKHYNLFLDEQSQSLGDRQYLETFFGMFEKISDDMTKGAGFINCYRLIVVLFDKKLIPLAWSQKHAKMILDQFFLPFVPKNVAKPIVNQSYIDDLYTFDLSLTDEVMRFLASQGFKLKSKDIGHATGPLKKQTERDAYDAAIAYLNRYGINEVWANKTKIKLEFEQPALLPYKSLIEKKNMQLGYDYVYFNYPTKTATQNQITVQLIGVNGKNKTILSSIVEDINTNKIDTKVKLIKQYLQQGY